MTIAADTAASTLRSVIKGRPPRLSQVFQTYDPPLYFVTICTLQRRRINNLEIVHAAFVKYAHRAIVEFNVAVGRYALLPGHLHLFVRGGHDFILKNWIAGLKRAMSVAMKVSADNIALWQPGFFDHILRNDESYAEKWNYVSENPVRHGLVESRNEWPYQGEIVYIDRA